MPPRRIRRRRVRAASDYGHCVSARLPHRLPGRRPARAGARAGGAGAGLAADPRLPPADPVPVPVAAWRPRIRQPPAGTTRCTAVSRRKFRRQPHQRDAVRLPKLLLEQMSSGPDTSEAIGADLKARIGQLVDAIVQADEERYEADFVHFLARARPRRTQAGDGGHRDRHPRHDRRTAVQPAAARHAAVPADRGRSLRDPRLGVGDGRPVLDRDPDRVRAGFRPGAVPARFGARVQLRQPAPASSPSRKCCRCCRRASTSAT